MPNSGKKTRLDRKRLKRALKFAAPYRGRVFVIFSITLALAAINAAEPLVMKFIIDALPIDPGTKTNALARGIAYLIGLGLVREIATAATNWLTWHTRLGIHYELLGATVERLHRLPLSFHRKEGVGAVMTKLDRGIQGFINAISQILFNVFPALLYLGISVFIMFRLDWRLAVAVLVFAPIPAIIAAFATPEQTRRDRALLDRWANIYSRFEARVITILLNQFQVRAGFHDMTILQNDDLVGAHDRRQTMGDDKRRSIRHQTIERLLHQHLRLRIEARRRFVLDLTC